MMLSNDEDPNAVKQTGMQVETTKTKETKTKQAGANPQKTKDE